MHAHSHTLIEFDGRTYGPGVFECTSSEFHSLAQRGPVRPATQDEIAIAAQAVPLTETAAVARDSEHATARRSARARREIATA